MAWKMEVYHNHINTTLKETQKTFFANSHIMPHTPEAVPQDVPTGNDEPTDEPRQVSSKELTYIVSPISDDSVFQHDSALQHDSVVDETLTYATDSYPIRDDLTRLPLHSERWVRGHEEICCYAYGHSHAKATGVTKISPNSSLSYARDSYPIRENLTRRPLRSTNTKMKAGNASNSMAVLKLSMFILVLALLIAVCHYYDFVEHHNMKFFMGKVPVVNAEPDATH